MHYIEIILLAILAVVLLGSLAGIPFLFRDQEQNPDSYDYLFRDKNGKIRNACDFRR